MRLPGTRYQEPGWEQVRKLLGHCSLQVFRQLGVPDPASEAAALDSYTDAMALALRASARQARGEAPGNSYGDSVHDLALVLVYELQAQPAFWHAFAATLAGAEESAEQVLRKKVNDMYAGLRDKVDSDAFQVATGRNCSPNKIYTYRMLDMAYGDIAQLFANWERNQGQVAAILGREVEGIPIEVRQMKSIAGCRAEWVIRWSESLEVFAGAPGPLHTRSKRFSSLKNNAATIAEMLREIGDYEELSSNQDSGWQLDAGEAGTWMEDYWRVVAESGAAASGSPDEILSGGPDADADDEPAFSPSPGYAMTAAADALRQEPLAVRLAVFQKLLGASDDSYPAEWLDPATGELPPMQQLAAMGDISVPTLRKRRNELIERLLARVPQ